MKKIVTTLSLVLVLSSSVYSQIKYTDEITGQSYEGWEAVGVWIWDHNTEVGTTIVGGFGAACLISEIIDDRNHGCKVRWRDRRQSKRRLRRNRRR